MDRRHEVVEAARRVLAQDPSASVAIVAREAGVSRATFYRWFPSRAALLEALEIEPDPGAPERILAAAKDLVARDGLSRLSMDEVAETAGVSRASVYRIYPGKSALFGALLAAEAPFGAISTMLRRHHDDPPSVVLPMLLSIMQREAAPRVGILRALMFEVYGGTPDAVEAAQWTLRPMVQEVSGYLAAQMEAGAIRPMHPILAAEALVGPLVFFLITRSVAAPLAGLDVEPSVAAQTFAGIALRGLAAQPIEE